jgi:hypothetical protein
VRRNGLQMLMEGKMATATRWLVCSIFALVSGGALSVQAASVIYDVNVEFSGATAPSGSAPWIRATFDDGGSAGTVTLVLESLSLIDPEFVSEWSFNLDPSLDPNALSFSAPTKTGTFADPTVALGVDAFQAAGDGRYDIQVNFANAPPGDRFGAGDSVSYTITGISSLTASSFDYVAAPGGGLGPFRTAAHVQATGGGEQSGWVTAQVPEPGAALLMLFAFGIAARRSRA